MIDAYLDAPDQITIVRKDGQDKDVNDLAVIQEDGFLSIAKIEDKGSYITVWLSQHINLDHFTHVRFDDGNFPLQMGKYTLSIEFDLKIGRASCRERVSTSV